MVSEMFWTVILFTLWWQKKKSGKAFNFGTEFTCVSPDKRNKYLIKYITTTLSLAEMFLKLLSVTFFPQKTIRQKQ